MSPLVQITAGIGIGAKIATGIAASIAMGFAAGIVTRITAKLAQGSLPGSPGSSGSAQGIKDAAMASKKNALFAHTLHLAGSISFLYIYMFYNIRLFNFNCILYVAGHTF